MSKYFHGAKKIEALSVGLGLWVGKVSLWKYLVGLMMVVELASLEPMVQDTQSVISKFPAHEVSTIHSTVIGIALAPPFMAEGIVANYCNSCPN
jgi:hypothetical protein